MLDRHTVFIILEIFFSLELNVYNFQWWELRKMVSENISAFVTTEIFSYWEREIYSQFQIMVAENFWIFLRWIMRAPQCNITENICSIRLISNEKLQIFWRKSIWLNWRKWFEMKNSVYVGRISQQELN